MAQRAHSSPTLHDVAREAGVSLATASRSLNGSTRKVNEEYRARVLAAAERLGYVANLSAQTIAKGTSSTLALLVSDIADPYFAAIAAGVLSGAEQAGLITTMGITQRSAERELDLVKTLRGQRPRVLILTGSRYVDAALDEALTRELQAFESTGGRVVMVSQRSLPFDTVQTDDYGGARDLAESLVDQGYRSFAALTGVSSLMTARDRLAGFRDGLAAHGLSLPDERVVETEFTRQGGYDGAGQLLSRGLGDAELLFAVNDVMAVGAMSRLREESVDVPGSLAVAGFDDISTARDVTPALTTVRLPLERVGAAAIELALAGQRGDEPTLVTLGGEVVLRTSTPARG
ncbi:LacI family DNA-binding transcriptional regulator [Microcella daejeonensis]|uniref:LacI family DNA-binding transcriptional regulator n=1 Tax=Microcella daejeonensis TaxID=2994971 RepID=A0A9E8MNI9_9MICO|nr:LacI family DNA-binding transcriptional regulator [Microcella daejeonensis]WAB82006.1 LacI family DNA-binding transcriptional regulator [Microcella daejeonensis]